ncbi:hypothetical protein ACHAXR_007434 [Thalassiosira sp. AJA248-18]
MLPSRGSSYNKHLSSSLLLLLITITTTIQTTSSQADNHWWCGSTHTHASESCTQPCPTGHGCPIGTVCFSGITSCSSSTTTANQRYCGKSLDDANAKCGEACPSGQGCPVGEACFVDTTCGGGGSGGLSFDSSATFTSPTASFTSSSSASSNAAIQGLTGTAAIEATFVQMKTAINEKLFLYETPMLEWIPSTVYRFDGFFDGLKIMHSQGVAGKTIYMGERNNNEDCDHCHMYGLINVAAFLAQAMKETIRYDACDENSWDRVGSKLMYPISNACGQLGQSYQDYHCSEEEKHMECEVDPEMSITAVTNAKWWGAPGPLKCGPKSEIPQTGYWDFSYTCDNIWGNPPETCDAYEGQKGGKAINAEKYPNVAGRTDVEGCCWWGRGVIQTSGVCNFGKLNYFLGKRAADDGRESRYPDIDFCKDPEAICSSREHQELKWIAGFFYWISDVQVYESDGWNYIDELHKFVDNGMEGDEFINAVSGIVNRPCGTGALDGGPERAQNFFDIIKEMKFSFVDVDPQPPPPEPVFSSETPRPTPHPTPWPTSPPFPGSTPRPTPPPFTTPATLTSAGAAAVVRYACGDGYQFDPSDMSIPPSSDVAFDYEIHNGIDVTVGDALRDVKGSMLSDIAESMGCYETYSGRKLQSDGFESIIGLQSNGNDLPDPDALGCIVDVETDDPATCTPVSGGFTVHAKPGTSESSLKKTVKSLKSIIETSMATGRYETETVVKAIYIGDRAKFSKASSSAPINVQSDETTTKSSNEGLKIAIYILTCACLVLICVLWFAVWTYREKLQIEQHHRDEEMPFDNFLMEKNENKHSMHSMRMAPQVSDYQPHSPQRRPPPPPPRQMSQNINRQDRFEGNGVEQFPHRPRSTSRGSSMDRRERDHGIATHQAPPFQMNEPQMERSPSISESSSEPSVEDMTPIIPQHMTGPRSKSAPRFQSNAQQRIPPASRKALSEGESVSSSDSSDDSSGDSSEDETYNDIERKVPAAPVRPMRGSPPRRSSNGNNNNNSTGYNKSMDESFQSNSSSAREVRQQRMAAARARAAKRRSVG